MYINPLHMLQVMMCCCHYILLIRRNLLTIIISAHNQQLSITGLQCVTGSGLLCYHVYRPRQ